MAGDRLIQETLVQSLSSGLVPVIVQDWRTGEVRMFAYVNKEALKRTEQTGLAWFWSRSRQSLWQKGESSGHVLRVREVRTDCDGDVLLYLVETETPTCHTGSPSCFVNQITDSLGDSGPKISLLSDEHRMPALRSLWSQLEARRDSTSSKSYTKSLLEGGPELINKKITEEANELCVAITGQSDERVVSEFADLMFHAAVGALSRGASIEGLLGELGRRLGTSGHVEKSSRTNSTNP